MGMVTGSARTYGWVLPFLAPSAGLRLDPVLSLDLMLGGVHPEHMSPVDAG
jgi:hypothetical protein